MKVISLKIHSEEKIISSVAFQLAAELESDRLAEALKRLAPSVEAALQQNEIANVFVNDWTLLSADGSSIGSEAGNNLQEFQSFTDLVFSKVWY